jgi:hypothetical protein
MGVEEKRELSLVEILRVLDARRGFDPVGVVEQNAEIADASNAGLRADRRLASFEAGVAENALLRLSGSPANNPQQSWGIEGDPP